MKNACIHIENTPSYWLFGPRDFPTVLFGVSPASSSSHAGRVA